MLGTRDQAAACAKIIIDRTLVQQQSLTYASDNIDSVKHLYMAVDEVSTCCSQLDDNILVPCLALSTLLINKIDILSALLQCYLRHHVRIFRML